MCLIVFFCCLLWHLMLLFTLIFLCTSLWLPVYLNKYILLTSLLWGQSHLILPGCYSDVNKSQRKSVGCSTGVVFTFEENTSPSYALQTYYMSKISNRLQYRERPKIMIWTLDYHLLWLFLMLYFTWLKNNNKTNKKTYLSHIRPLCSPSVHCLAGTCHFSSCLFKVLSLNVPFFFWLANLQRHSERQHPVLVRCTYCALETCCTFSKFSITVIKEKKIEKLENIQKPKLLKDTFTYSSYLHDIIICIYIVHV